RAGPRALTACPPRRRSCSRPTARWASGVRRASSSTPRTKRPSQTPGRGRGRAASRSACSAAARTSSWAMRASMASSCAWACVASRPPTQATRFSWPSGAATGGIRSSAAAWRAAVGGGGAGLECLSGIPGLVGATPIQNVGAYGQEVAETLVALRALDTRSGRVVRLTHTDCRFAYRDSLFKSGEPGRFIVLDVTYRLRRGGEPTLRYAEVAQHLGGRGVGRPSLAEVRASVIAIRRSKSMVIDPGDENARSCGSFFTNPIVSVVEADRVQAVTGEPVMPRYPQADGRVKLAAAWLIEHAGFSKGQRDGAVGLSTRHALAVVAHAGATAGDVIAFARRIQHDVEARFGVRLLPEPVFWGV